MTNEAKILGGIGILTIVIVIAAAFLFGGKSSPDSNQTPVSTAQQKILIRKDSHEITAPAAKVTLVEFGDFQCPACGAAYPIVTQILNNYKGKINFVFREYPLPVHQNADAAAEAAEAAGAQGKFFEMYNLLYSNQNSWGDSTSPMDYFTKYAQGLHLNMNKFKSDVQSKKYAGKIQQDQNDGNTLGVNATPTFYINGVQQVGGLPYSDFKSKIDAAIKVAK